jgi:hypothetical protein
MTATIDWPDGKRFAFTVFDDTDSATLDNVGEVYRMLADLGMKTTKSCWLFRGDPSQGKWPGQTCDDPTYLQWLQKLQAQGFEIGWHGATWNSVSRQTTLDALDRFAAVFGHNPYTAANHSGAAGGIYWADARLSGLHRWAYTALTRGKNRGKYRGHVEGDEHYWGDACKQRVTYYRNFVYQDINTLRACPVMPYHDPQRPFVNYWFASSNGDKLESFNRCLSEAHQDRLEEQGGACIMYSHFAFGFQNEGKLDARFRALAERMARKNGWFVPVHVLLDYLRSKQATSTITAGQRRSLEQRWLWEKLFVGTN